jgi:hypothetical protein
MSVTGDHLSFEGNCGVRPTAIRSVAGDPTVYGPSLSSAFSDWLLVCRCVERGPDRFSAPLRRLGWAVRRRLCCSLLSTRETLTGDGKHV